MVVVKDRFFAGGSLGYVGWPIEELQPWRLGGDFLWIGLFSLCFQEEVSSRSKIGEFFREQSLHETMATANQMAPKLIQCCYHNFFLINYIFLELPAHRTAGGQKNLFRGKYERLLVAKSGGYFCGCIADDERQAVVRFWLDATGTGLQRVLPSRQIS